MKRKLILQVLVALAAVCLLSVSALADYWHTPLTAGPKTTALYNFDEGQGGTANDIAGSTNNALALHGGANWEYVGSTDHGGLHAPADFGYALALDGSTGYADTPDDPELEFPGFPALIEFWLKPQPRGGDHFDRIVNKYSGTHRSWEIFAWSDTYAGIGDGEWHLAGRFGPGGESNQTVPTVVLPLLWDQWQFVRWEFDAGGAPHVYINGEESPLYFPRWETAITGIKDGTDPMTVGDFGGTPDTDVHNYAGLIDDLRLTVPEPGSLLALGGLAGGLAGLLRKRR